MVENEEDKFELEKDDLQQEQEEFIIDDKALQQRNAELEEKKKKSREKAEKLREKIGNPEPIIITLDNKIKKASELTTEEQEIEFIRCVKDPIYFIETYLTIFDQTKGKEGQIVPFKLFDFQRKLINDYKNNRFNIVNKYRQAGISTTTCAYLAWYISFNENRYIAVVADKQETATNELMNDVIEFMEGCPKWLVPSPDKKDTQKLKRYSNGSAIGAFSSKGLRGYTPTLLFWDEVAWTEKNDIFWKSTKPTLQTGGRAIMVSTPNGMDPTYYKTFMGAKSGENQFNASELWWFNDPRYNKGLIWYKYKNTDKEKKLVDKKFSNKERIQMWDDGWKPTSEWFENEVRNANGDMKAIAREIECSFLSSGDNFIAEKFLERIEEQEIKEPIRTEFTDNNMWIWEDPLPETQYVVTIDASPGHGDDFSTINILKIIETYEHRKIIKGDQNKVVKQVRHRLEQVAEYYGKISPNELTEMAYTYCKTYNGAYCVVDITGGYGIQVIEKVFEFGYENVHYSQVIHKPSREMLNGYVKKSSIQKPDGTVKEVDLIPGFFIGNNRSSVLLEFQRSIHLGELIIRSKRTLEEMKTFVTVNGSRVADHKRSFHDDSIMGIAIGGYTINFEMKRFKIDNGKTKKMLDAMINSKNAADKEKQKNYEKLYKKNKNPYGNNAWLFQGLNRKR